MYQGALRWFDSTVRYADANSTLPISICDGARLRISEALLCAPLSHSPFLPPLCIALRPHPAAGRLTQTGLF
jgi:hypothetical protein